MVFSELSRGEVKNFCCEESLALDHDLVQLLQPEKNLLDLYRDVLAAHTNRLLAKLVQRSHNHPDSHSMPGCDNLFIEGLEGKSISFVSGASGQRPGRSTGGWTSERRAAGARRG